MVHLPAQHIRNGSIRVLLLMNSSYSPVATADSAASGQAHRNHTFNASIDTGSGDVTVTQVNNSKDWDQPGTCESLPRVATMGNVPPVGTINMINMQVDDCRITRSRDVCGPGQQAEYSVSCTWTSTTNGITTTRRQWRVWRSYREFKVLDRVLRVMRGHDMNRWRKCNRPGRACRSR